MDAKRHTLCCILQNASGALDRALGALTYRGFTPEQMLSSIDAEKETMTWIVTFACDDDHQVAKLIKILEKQIYVIEVQNVLLPSNIDVASPSELLDLFSRVTFNRRLNTHVHTA